MIDETVRLGAVWRPAVEKHLLALSPDDRYGRFASALSDAAVAAYAGRIDFARDLCLAMVEAEGRLSGVIHLAVHGQVAELGASVLPGWRREGRARRGLAEGRAAAAVLRGRGGAPGTGHPAARHICGGLGYSLREGAAYPRLRGVLARGGAERGR